MKAPIMLMVMAVCALAVGVAAYYQGNEPGADIRYAKTSEFPRTFVKDQSRILPE